MAARRHMPAVPLKLKKTAGAAAAAVLEDEVAVEEDGLRPGSGASSRGSGGPSGPGPCRSWDRRSGGRRRRKPGSGDEVGVEDGDELALRGLRPVLERAGLVAGAVGAVEVDDGCGGRPSVPARVTLDDGRGDVSGLVGGVVEDLDLEAVARVVDAAAGVDEAVDDELLVDRWGAGR